jgi:flagellar biosynthesis protein
VRDNPKEHPRQRPAAVAVRYDAEKEAAPRVVAKGRGLIAEKILEIAKEHGISVVEDPDLIEVLARVELDSEIPSNLYQAMAEVLAFVYRVNQVGMEKRR